MGLSKNTGIPRLCNLLNQIQQHGNVNCSAVYAPYFSDLEYGYLYVHIAFRKTYVYVHVTRRSENPA